LILIAVGMGTTQISDVLPLMYLLLGLSILASARAPTPQDAQDGVPLPAVDEVQRSVSRPPWEGLLAQFALGVALLFATLSTAVSLFGLNLGTLRPVTAIFPLGPYRMYTESVHDPFGYVVNRESGETVFDPRRREDVLASGLWMDINYRTHRDVMGSICFSDEKETTESAILARIDHHSAQGMAYLADRWGPDDYEITVWDMVHGCEVKRVRVSVG